MTPVSPASSSPPSPAPPPATAAFDVAELRRTEFPWTDGTTYLNNASIGPLPERTRLALEAFNRRRAMPFQLPDRDLFGTLTESRRLVAELLSAAPEEIALTVNTSFGLGVVARALPLERGRHRAGERPRVSRQRLPLAAAARDRDQVELVPTTPSGWPDEARLLERLADPRVRVLAVSLVQFSSGYRVDLAALSAATRRTGALLVVDAIQGVGQVPVDLRADAGGRAGLRRAEMAAVARGARVSSTCGGT